MVGRIYSVGYEGFTLSAFVDRLRAARVDTVVDVRLNPISRKPGFSKKRLAEALGEAGIQYIHERGLGNPADNREDFRSGDGEAGRERLRQLLAEDGDEAIGRLVDLASTQRVAVLCVERERHRCHREVITDLAVERNAAIEVLAIL